MLIAGTITNNSNDYSIVNKEYVKNYTVQCVVTELNAISNASYIIIHNLNTPAIIIDVQERNSSPENVMVSYSIIDNNSIRITFSRVSVSTASIPVRIVIFGSAHYATGTYTLDNEQQEETRN